MSKGKRKRKRKGKNKGKLKGKLKGKDKGKGKKLTDPTTHNHTHVVLDHVGALDPTNGEEFEIRVHIAGATRSQILSLSGTVVGPEDPQTPGWIGFDVEWKRGADDWVRLGSCRLWWNTTAPAALVSHVTLPTRFIDLYPTDGTDNRFAGGVDDPPKYYDLRLLPFKTQVVMEQQRLQTNTDDNDVFSVAFSELDHTGVGDKAQ